MFDSNRNIKCHIELSNYCNAACPMCSRNLISKTYPHEMTIRNDVDNSQLRIDDIKKIFDDRFFKTYNLDAVNMCGVRGDPATALDLFEICEYLLSKNNNLEIQIATNGGLKTASYWKKIGNLFTKYNNNSKIVFGIDGLEDTNHIYRQNVNFKKVMKNAQAFIDGGGNAEWQYLMFKHNEHQVGEAKELAENMGFTNFFIVNTNRWGSVTNNGYKVFTYKGKTHVLETADSKFDIIQDTFEFIHSDEAEEIKCKSIERNQFYIDSFGRLLPCCWFGGSLNKMMSYLPKKYDSIMNFYDTEEMNVIKNDLVDTLQHRFLTESVPLAWKNIEGKNCSSRTCKSMCSKTKNFQKKKEYV